MTVLEVSKGSALIFLPLEQWSCSSRSQIDLCVDG